MCSNYLLWSCLALWQNLCLCKQWHQRNIGDAVTSNNLSALKCRNFFKPIFSSYKILVHAHVHLCAISSPLSFPCHISCCLCLVQSAHSAQLGRNSQRHQPPFLLCFITTGNISKEVGIDCVVKAFLLSNKLVIRSDLNSWNQQYHSCPAAKS